MIWVPEVLGGRSPRPDAAAYTRVLMADKPKKQKAKAKKDEPGVLGSLSSARPERIGSHRGSTGRARAAAQPTANAKAGAAKTAAAARPKPRAKPAAPRTFEPTPAAETAARETAATATPTADAQPKRAKAKAKPKTTAKAKTAAKPKAAAKAKPKAAAPRTFEPTPAATAAARERPATSRPRPVRDAAPGIGGRREDFEETGTSRPSGAELAATAAKAAGEVAQLGLAIGGKLLKRASERIPKP